MRMFPSWLRRGRTYITCSVIKRLLYSGFTSTVSMDDASRKAQLVSDMNKFKDSFPKLMDQLSASFTMEEIKDGMAHYQESVMYSLFGGKMNRGMTVLTTWRILLGDKQPTDEEHFSAIVLAWCVEFLQTSFLVADDVVDQSQTRRGKPCWYKKENVGLVAVNDAFMLESSVYRLVDMNFRDKKCYPNLITLLHETTFQTEVGQTLDLITKPGENFCNFTLERYKAIVKWKTAFYSFYLPVALAMYMMDVTDKKAHEKAKTILFEMGEFFQIQDDYLDCYGDPAVTGKIGTDIEETKCSWLLVEALKRVDEKQMNILKENYGINDPDSVAKVKKVYAELNMTNVYREYEERSYAKLMELIDTAPKELPKEIFTELAKKIYKRDK